MLVEMLIAASAGIEEFMSLRKSILWTERLLFVLQLHFEPLMCLTTRARGEKEICDN